MSSFKNEDQRKKKLTYPGNFPITANDSDVIDGNSKDGYIKAEQFYCFNKENTNFIIIGSMSEEAFNLLIEFIEQLNNIEYIIDNLN